MIDNSDIKINVKEKSIREDQNRLKISKKKNKKIGKYLMIMR